MNFESNLKTFKNYVSNYDLTDDKIKYKYDHTLRVVEFARKICASEDFNEKETFLGLTAALLHDIARFEEWTTYKSFLTIDHGDLGYDFLKKDDYILEYVQKEYADVILIAVKYHNKKDMPSNLSVLEEKILKLVRDADKIDILNTQYNTENKDSLNLEINYSDKNDIPKDLLDDFLDEKMIIRKKVKNTTLLLLYYFAYIYDINYKKTFQLIDELNVIPIHLELFHKMINNEEQYKIVENKVISYINSKL